MNLTKPVFAAAVLGLLCLSASARADVPPPETFACTNLSVGATCDLAQTSPAHDGGGGPQGVCTTSTCSRLDYAHWDHDASASPPTMQYECLKCLAPTDAGSSDAQAADGAGGMSGMGGAGGTSGTGGFAFDAGAGSGGSKSDSSGCTLSGAPARALGPWAFGLLFAAVVLFARRRR